MASRDLKYLHREMIPKVQSWLHLCEQNGIHILVTCTYRSPDEQAALHAQGRSALFLVNELRKRVALPPITETANQKKVTNAKPGDSAHNFELSDGTPASTAVDFVPLIGGKPEWDADSPLWEKCGELAEQCGLEWSGRWKGSLREQAHVQYYPPLLPTVVCASAT